MNAPVARARLRIADLGTCLSSRKHSEVFRLGSDRVLKLFRAHVRTEQVEHELQTTLRVHAAGVPTPAIEPAVFETDSGRRGLVLEYIDATPCSELFLRQPHRIGRFVRQFADLHRRVHGFDGVEGLPVQRMLLRDRLLQSGRLSLRHRQQLLARLETFADARRLCHGNFHPSNVLIAGERAWVLSVGNASNGDPLADVARTSAILAYPDVKSGGFGGWLSTRYSRWRNRLYLARYLDGTHELQSQFDTWFIIQMARRLEDGIAKAEGAALEREILRRLKSDAPPSVPVGTA
jgi:Ser/Thr protein kinase RdoA (MazF antagonist)